MRLQVCSADRSVSMLVCTTAKNEQLSHNIYKLDRFLWRTVALQLLEYFAVKYSFASLDIKIYKMSGLCQVV